MMCSVLFNSTWTTGSSFCLLQKSHEALLSWHFNDSVFYDRDTTNYAIAKKLYCLMLSIECGVKPYEVVI